MERRCACWSCPSAGRGGCRAWRGVEAVPPPVGPPRGDGCECRCGEGLRMRWMMYLCRGCPSALAAGQLPLFTRTPGLRRFFSPSSRGRSSCTPMPAVFVHTHTGVFSCRMRLPSRSTSTKLLCTLVWMRSRSALRHVHGVVRRGVEGRPPISAAPCAWCCPPGRRGPSADLHTHDRRSTGSGVLEF